MDIHAGEVSILRRLPFNSNLEAVFQLKAYLNTAEGADQYKNWGIAYKNHKLTKTWIPVAIIGVILIALLTGNLFSHFKINRTNIHVNNKTKGNFYFCENFSFLFYS